MQVINICHNEHYKLDDAINVDISNINSIPNFSAKALYIAFLNRIQKNQAIELIKSLCEKLANGGSMTFKLLDFHQLIRYYENQEITNNDIPTYTNSLHCIITKSEILELFHKNDHINITSITYDKVYSTYTLSRIQL
jgi:hypothetical protein